MRRRRRATDRCGRDRLGEEGAEEQQAKFDTRSWRRPLDRWSTPQLALGKSSLLPKNITGPRRVATDEFSTFLTSGQTTVYVPGARLRTAGVWGGVGGGGLTSRGSPPSAVCSAGFAAAESLFCESEGWRRLRVTTCCCGGSRLSPLLTRPMM